jgi:hypothetical protein
VRHAPLLLLLTACLTPRGPDEVARAYAEALRDDRLEHAYALSTREHRERVSLEAFRLRHADAAKRAARAEEILRSLDSMRARSAAVEAQREPEGWRVSELFPESGVKETLIRFLDAAEGGDFDAAYALLSGEWRGRYTAKKLQSDFAADPRARDRLQRARAALGGEIRWRGETAELEVGEGRAVKLVREGDAFRVSALE